MLPDSIPRYCPGRELPPYSYVTGLFPHPTRDERGHSFGRHELPADALEEVNCRENETYLCALDLFNHGYYWESHEAWESLWHACGRRGPTADFLKGLIKLAAAGVKAREGRLVGVKQHAERAAELFSGVGSQDASFGLSLTELRDVAADMARRADDLAGDRMPNAHRRLPVILRLIARP